MRQLKSFLVTGFTVILSISMFSCIDSSFDLSNLSKEAELFKNSLSAPVGTATIRLDSVIGSIDINTSILSVKNNTYTFGYRDSFDIGSITDSLNSVKLNAVSGISTPINLIDASGGIPQAPYYLPKSSYEYNSSLNLPLPSFNQSLIDIDSILLENTYLEITASPVGFIDYNKSISLTLNALGNTAEYYDLNGNRLYSWTMYPGETSRVEVRKLHLSGGGNALGLGTDISINIQNSGDVEITRNIQTHVNFTMTIPNGISYHTIWGKVNYTTQGNLNNIKFDAFGNILKENDVLDLYNPKIVLGTKGNLGIPLNIDLNSISASNSTETRYLSGASFQMQRSKSPDKNVENTFVLDRSNGTPDLFKIAPDQISLGYKIKSNPDSSAFISKNTNLSMSYNIEIPLQFGGDFHLSLGTTLKNPFAGHLNMLKDQDNLKTALLLDVENRIPLTFQIALTALDKDSVAIASFGQVKSDIIDAAPVDPVTGFATDYRKTPVEIALTPAQINQLKDVEMFKIDFMIMTGKSGDSNYKATVQPSDYIKIKIGGKINGGILLDLSSNSN